MPPSGRTRAIIVGSVGFHALAILVLSRCELERPLRDGTAMLAPRVEVVPLVDVTSLGVELVTLPPAIDPDSLLAPSEGTKGSRVAIGSGTGAGRELGRGTAERTTSGGESLRMRGRRHELRMSGSMLDKFLENSKPLPVIPHDDRLLPNGGAGHVIYDRVTTLTVARDGTATFADKPDIDPKLTLPIMSFDEIRTGIGNHLSAWYADPYKDQRAAPVQELPRHMTAVPGACDKVGDPMCDTGPNEGVTKKSLGRGIVPVVGGNADITAYLHRKFIGDPYASRKLKLLDTTREARIQIGTNHRSEQRDRASEYAQRNVEALWKATTDPTERKAALFALWDECVESESADGEAGERARAIILGWIRGKLPAGSPGAFTVEEIAKLDAARTSHQHFVPY